MYCQNCGEKLINDSMFCMNCGIEIKINATTPKESNENSPNQNSSRETTHSNESNKKGSENKADELVNKSVSPHHHSPVPHAVEQNTANKQTSDQNETKQTTTKLNRLMPTLPFLIPIVCFIIASLSVGFYYIYEDNQNDKVLKLQKSAEEAALNGAYKDAIERLNKAIDIRPNYKTLTEDLQEVERANDVFADIDTVHELITEQEFEKAKEKLNVLKEQIMEETGPLFISLNEKVANKEATLIIDEIKKELDSITTVDVLANKLNQLASLSSDEALELETQLLSKMVQITTKEATAHLEKEQFDDALRTINKGLSYKEDDQELLALKDKIEQEKIAFEQQVTDEDVHNRTAAVEFESFSADLDGKGNVYIEGTIISTATIPIYSITVYYSVYDENGNFLEDGFTTVEPNKLNPGDKGTFSDTIEGIDENVTVQITNVIWFFD